MLRYTITVALVALATIAALSALANKHRYENPPPTTYEAFYEANNCAPYVPLGAIVITKHTCDDWVLTRSYK